MTLGTSHAVQDKHLALKVYRRCFGIEDFHSHLRWRAIKRYVNYDADRMLEVGANSGVMTFMIAAQLRGTLVASELEPHLADEAQAICQRSGITNVEFSQADLRELALTPATFDQVLLIDVLEHIDDHQQALVDLAASLRAGGTLVLSVPTPNYPTVFGRTFHESIGHVRDGYWLEDLLPLLARAGLDVEDHHYYTGTTASRCCSLIYRHGLSFKAQWMVGPLLRPFAFAGERAARRDSCASIALLARKRAV